MDIPQPRRGHCSVHVDGKVVVWGGRVNEHANNIPASVVETFGCTSGQWGSVHTTGTAPLAVWRSATVAMERCLYSFGGRHDALQYSRDLHRLDSALMEWMKVETSNPSDGPSPKAECGMIRRGTEELVVVGGWLRGGRTNEVHAIHIREGTWYAPTVTGDVPPPLYGFSLLNIDEYHAVLFGGYMEGPGWSTDVYYLDLRIWTFKKVGASGSSRPRGRRDPAAVIIGGSLMGSQPPQLLIIGGLTDGHQTLSDAWVGTLGRTVTWKEVDLPPGVGPRLEHTATVISSGRGSALVLVHGGRRSQYSDGEVVSAPAIIQLEGVVTMETAPQWTVVKVVAMEDQRRWKGLFDYIQKCDQLCTVLIEKKTISLKSANMVVNGPPGSGKSTIIRRGVYDLSATVPALNLPSTPILEKPMVVGIKKLTQRRAAVKDSSWVAQTVQDEKHRALQRTLTLAEAKDIQETDTSPAQASGESRPPRSSTHSSQPAQTMDIGPQPFQPTSGQDPHEPPAGQRLPSTPLEAMPSFESPDEMIRTALRNLDALKNLNDLEGTTMLHIVDTGGQPEFRSILSWLLLRPAITVQVFNLSIGLKERYDVWYRAQDGQTTEPYRSSFTVEEVLFQAQSSIAYLETSPCPSELPFELKPFQSKSIFVGTHRDLVSDEDVSHVDSTLQKQLECSTFPSDRVVYHRDPHTSSINVVVPIDNTNPDDPGIRLFQELVNEILKKMPSSQLPVSWEWFKLSVLSTNAKMMTVDQCVVIGRASGMEDKKEVELALWYHTHFTGQIQHYDIKGIEDTVWLDPQLISDGMSSLVSSSFHMKGPMERRQVIYRKTGRFPVAEVRKFLAECCREVPSEKLITLFEYLHVLSPIPDKEGRTMEYFVPCALQPEEVERLTRGPPSASHPAPLLFTFSTGFTPMGVFHVLVVYLSSPEAASLQWVLCIAGKAQYRNKVTFFVGDDLDEVTLIERPQVIEVWIDREDDATETDCCHSLPAVCQEVRLTLDAALTHVKSSKKSILRVRHQAAVYCERAQCDPAPHYALPRGNGPPKNAMCSFSNYPCRLGPYQRIWFGEGGGESTLESATTTDSCLGGGVGSRHDTGRQEGATAQSAEGHAHRRQDMQQVGKLGPGDLLDVLTELRDVRAEWEDIGLALKMSPGALRAMKGPFKPPKDCQRDMLTDWLNTSDASWSSLVDALRQPIVGHGNLAAELERKYLTQAEERVGSGDGEGKARDVAEFKGKENASHQGQSHQSSLPIEDGGDTNMQSTDGTDLQKQTSSPSPSHAGPTHPLSLKVLSGQHQEHTEGQSTVDRPGREEGNGVRIPNWVLVMVLVGILVVVIGALIQRYM